MKWVRYLLLALSLLMGYHILSGPSGALNLFRIRQANVSLARELDSLKARKGELVEDKARLQKDSAYLEREARRELGMSRPEEKVFRFMAPGNGDASPEKPPLPPKANGSRFRSGP